MVTRINTGLTKVANSTTGLRPNLSVSLTIKSDPRVNPTKIMLEISPIDTGLVQIRSKFVIQFLIVYWDL